MKNLLKFIATSILGIMARAVVRRYKPRIVMVSGSVGKTSTKDAVAAVLTSRFLVRKSEKSFNSEFGVPFTILGVRNPWRDPLAWIAILKSSFALLVLPNHYPNILVLEVGADRYGDLKRILRIATPNSVVITRLPEIPVHVESYSTPEEVREEEFSPAYALPASAPLILPADDPYSVNMGARTPAHIISYGTSEGASVRIINSGFYIREGRVVGMQADIALYGERGSLIVRGSVGTTQILTAAAAIAAAAAFNIPLIQALKALETYNPPPGRGRILAGLNGSTVVDDSYNSSPAAVVEALATLKNFPYAKRRIAILGDMLELGRYSVTEHERIGELARDSADIVIAVGVRSRAYASADTTGKVMPFDNSRVAAHAARDMVQSGDVILVKGSQSIRTERIVEALLANPTDSSLLVRQEHEWKRRP